jgi:hypothetical protein
MDGNNINPLVRLAASPLNNQNPARAKGETTWFEALARAWGEALDRQAANVQELSENMAGQGEDSPSQIVDLTAASLRMQFMANSQSTSTSSVGQALETMARKN